MVSSLNSHTQAYAFLLLIFCVVILLIWLDIRREEAENQLLVDSSPKRTLVCYYTLDSSDLKPESIDTTLCSHVIAGFAGIDAKNCSIYFSESQLLILERFANSTKNKNLQRMISVGGAGNSNFGRMVLNHMQRKLFIKSLMKILKQYRLDGVDIDWEWPVIDGGNKQKVQFIQLLQEIQTEFNRHAKKYTLTAAVSAVESIVTASYYVQHIAEHVDFVNIMTYDYHFFNTFYPVTDYNSPLFSDPSDGDGAMSTFNINYTINLWLSLGMPANQIVLGLPTYGHTYRLRNSANHGRKAPAQGNGIGSDGFISYSQLCSFLETNDFVNVVRDKYAKVPYAYDSYNWISYDDSTSLTEKVFYAKKMNLRGVMVFSLNSDDHSGKCLGNSPYPLVNAVRYALMT